MLTAPGTDVTQLAAALNGEMANITSTGRIIAAPLEAMSSGMAQGIEVTVRGDNYDDVRASAEQLVARLESGGSVTGRRAEAHRRALQQLTNIRLELPHPRPGLVITPDVTKAMSLGLPLAQLQQLQQEFFMLQAGATVGQATLDGTPRQLFVQGVADRITSPATAEQLPVGFPQKIRLGDLATVTLDSGEEISRYYYVPRDSEDLLKRHDLMVTATRLGGGVIPFTKDIGSDAMNAVNIVADMMGEKKYLDRAEAYRRHLQKNDLSVACAMSDVKGNRSLHPSSPQQAHPDYYVRVGLLGR